MGISTRSGHDGFRHSASKTRVNALKAQPILRTGGNARAPTRYMDWEDYMARLSPVIAAAAIFAASAAFAQTREVPARSVPVLDTVSPQMQKIIAGPFPANWNVIPDTADGWRAQVQTAAVAALLALRAQLHVKVEPELIDGVKT